MHLRFVWFLCASWLSAAHSWMAWVWSRRFESRLLEVSGEGTGNLQVRAARHVVRHAPQPLRRGKTLPDSQAVTTVMPSGIQANVCLLLLIIACWSTVDSRVCHTAEPSENRRVTFNHATIYQPGYSYVTNHRVIAVFPIGSSNRFIVQLHTVVLVLLMLQYVYTYQLFMCEILSLANIAQLF